MTDHKLSQLIVITD